MRDFFTWFYCLDIPVAVTLAATAAAGFLFIKAWLGETRLWKASVFGLLGLWLVTVVYVTVVRREASGVQETSWIPFYSYYLAFSGVNEELLRSNFMNVMLFFPAGLLAGSVLPNSRKWVLLTALAGCAVSLCIEVAQYFFHLGLAETDDLIHNTLGTLLGAAIGGIKINLRRHRA